MLLLFYVVILRQRKIGSIFYIIIMDTSKVESYIAERITEFDQISEERKNSLLEFAKEVSKKSKKGEVTSATFICTHNSRRSHLSQVWAQVVAHHFGIPFQSYSGGTEATALYKSSAQAFRNAGLQVQTLSEGNNPVYAIKYTDNEPAVICFSKKYNDGFNVQGDFIAVMTCDNADQNCPYIPEASLRISIKYVDPKEADGTDYEQSRYDERSAQIAREMLFAFSNVDK